MEKNIGKTDKMIRIMVAIIAAYLGFKISPWFYIVTFLGLLTASTNYCLLYTLLKINTAKKSKKK